MKALLFMLFAMGYSVTACDNLDGSDAEDTASKDSATESDVGDTDGNDTDDTDIHDTSAPELPTLEELDDGWNELFPGGESICSRGTTFSFFVYPGTIDKVVVDFMGGGVCWNNETCAVGSEVFIDSVEPFRVAVAGGSLVGFNTPLDGIYNRAREDNPFKDWHHIIIPYCTGDIHWGDAAQDYGDVHIEHRGAVNTRAVLHWVYDNYQAPEQIFVTGCSAGSLGAALWSAQLMHHYPDSQVLEFGDSEAGVITDEFYENDFPKWNTDSAFPDWIDGLSPASSTLRIQDIYIGIANEFPLNFMSQFNSLHDSAQPFFFREMGGGDVETWSKEMIASLDAIEAGTDRFASFVPSGTRHCILPFEDFYTISIGGASLIDWLGEMLKNGSVKSVRSDTSAADLL